MKINFSFDNNSIGVKSEIHLTCLDKPCLENLIKVIGSVKNDEGGVLHTLPGTTHE